MLDLVNASQLFSILFSTRMEWHKRLVLNFRGATNFLGRSKVTDLMDAYIASISREEVLKS